MKSEVALEQMRVLISCGITVCGVLHQLGRDDVLERATTDPEFRKRIVTVIATQLQHDLAFGTADDYKPMVDAILEVS